MRALLVVGLLALLVSAAPATASPPQHVHGAYQDFAMDFHKRDGCLQRDTNLAMQTWHVGDTHVARLSVGVYIWDHCTDKSVFWAGGEFSNADFFSLSENLTEAHLRYEGELPLSIDGSMMPVTIDVQFVPLGRMTTHVDGPSACYADGEIADYRCTRRMHIRGGYAEGTVTVNGIEFFTPWSPQTDPEAVIENWARTMDSNVNCAIPAEDDVHACDLLSLP